jgi:uncharacterized membrane protein YesL
MTRLLDWHTRLGGLGLRLALLQGLWLLHTLMGAVVLGALPATAAVAAVLRRDHMVAAGWADDQDRPPLWREFHRAWRAELVGANAAGYVLVAAWALVVADHLVTRGVDVVAVPRAVVWVLTAVLAAVTGLALVLRAHFADGPVRALRRACVLALARPLLALQAVVVLAGFGCLFYVLPGLAVVFGVSAPAAVLVAAVWHTGVLPRPAATAAPALA